MKKLLTEYHWPCTVFCLACAGAIGWWLIRSGSLEPMVKLALFGFAVCAVAAEECWRWGGALQRQASAPNEPWLWRSDWARGEVVFSTGSEAMARWLLVLVPAGVGYGFAFMGILDHGLHAIITHWSFWAVTAIVMCFVAYAMVATRRWLRQGRESVLRLGTLPGRVGGKLTGIVSIKSRRHAAEGFEIRLRRLLHDMVLIQIGPFPVVAHNAGHGRLELPVTFDIPAGVQPTSDDAQSVEWVVTVKARSERDDFEATFEVPVFA
jgi:hypothetical protein